MKPWYFRLARGSVYAAFLISVLAIAIDGAWGYQNITPAFINWRQLYGLWSLATLLLTLMLGPIYALFPWLPLKSPMLYARRAFGVSALGFAILHVAAYLISVLRRDWHELYTPGLLWIIGLILGLFALLDMLALGFTSNDEAVKRMGGRSWKRLHRTIYLALLLILIHATCVGADFGFNHAPDLKGESDFGCLIGFTSVSAVWLLTAILRRKRWRGVEKLKAEMLKS